MLLFVVIGRANHHAGGALAGLWDTFWPFAAGAAAGMALTRFSRRPTALVPTGIGVWLSTVAIGMALRVLAGQGTAFASSWLRWASSACSSWAGGWCGAGPAPGFCQLTLTFAGPLLTSRGIYVEGGGTRPAERRGKGRAWANRRPTRRSRRSPSRTAGPSCASSPTTSWPPGRSPRRSTSRRTAVSQHLTVLKSAGLVTERRQGTRRLYRARPEGLDGLREFLDEMWAASLDAARQMVEAEHGVSATPRPSRAGRIRTGGGSP